MSVALHALASADMRAQACKHVHAPPSRNARIGAAQNRGLRPTGTRGRWSTRWSPCAAPPAESLRGRQGRGRGGVRKVVAEWGEEARPWARGSLACAGPASGGSKRTWAAVGVDGRASRRAALGAREQVQQTCHEERSRAVGGGLAGVASGIGAVRGANGRLAVVQGGTGAGMRPPSRLAGEGFGGRAARGPERGWWHLAQSAPSCSSSSAASRRRSMGGSEALFW